MLVTSDEECLFGFEELDAVGSKVETIDFVAETTVRRGMGNYYDLAIGYRFAR